MNKSKQIAIRPRRQETHDAIVEAAKKDGIKKFIYGCIMVARPELRPVIMRDLGLPEEMI